MCERVLKKCLMRNGVFQAILNGRELGYFARQQKGNLFLANMQGKAQKPNQMYVVSNLTSHPRPQLPNRSSMHSRTKDSFAFGFLYREYQSSP